MVITIGDKVRRDAMFERILEAGLRHFGVEPWLFGSQLNDTERGGEQAVDVSTSWPSVRSGPWA